VSKKPVGRPRQYSDPEIELGEMLTSIVDLESREIMNESVRSVISSYEITIGNPNVDIDIITAQLVEALFYYREFLSIKFVRQGVQKPGPKQKIAEQVLIRDIREILSKQGIETLQYWRNGRAAKNSLHEFISDLCRNSGVNPRFNASARSHSSKSISFIT
jgi:hypothetical protein